MELKQNCSVRSINFLEENTLLSSGYDADMYLWDLRYTGRCVNRFIHEDGTPTSCIASYIPPVDSNSYHIPHSFVAVGSQSGVMAIYEKHSHEANKWYAPHNPPKPMKSIMNLTNKITSACFHPSGQILAMASYEKKDQLKMVHLPSGNVFMNWPTIGTPLGYVECMDFSPNGKYFVSGNKKGSVWLSQLKQLDVL